MIMHEDAVGEIIDLVMAQLPVGRLGIETTIDKLSENRYSERIENLMFGVIYHKLMSGLSPDDVNAGVDIHDIQDPTSLTWVTYVNLPIEIPETAARATFKVGLSENQEPEITFGLVPNKISGVKNRFNASKIIITLPHDRKPVRIARENMDKRFDLEMIDTIITSLEQAQIDGEIVTLLRKS